jgi:EAL domain-containing protein (putative c-di-GMP-specific phosphodiesterase class I)
MALFDLVEYFNNRFEQEHHANYRPLVIENNQVIGLFGQLSIGSIFSSLRDSANSKMVNGHAVKIKVSANESPHLYNYELDNLALNSSETHLHFESVINFDRLARTVHALNYLSMAQSDKPLFLEVDPRHILGIKQDHGAYFETIIEQCGLTTKNTVIVLAVTSNYVPYNEALIRGLSNYRRRGYQIALRFDHLITDMHAAELIFKLTPNYVSLSARQIETESNASALKKLHALKHVISTTQGKGILRQIDRKKSELLARESGFDLVEGDYYEKAQTVSNF